MPFKAHQLILCSQSDYFKAACKEQFEEGRSKTIKLIDISPAAFERILKWMYREGLDIPDDISDDDLLAFYRAVDYLQITALRAEIFREVTNRTKQWAKSSGTPKRSFSTLWHNLSCLADICHVDDFCDLKTALQPVVPGMRYLSDVKPTKASNFPTSDPMLLNALVDCMNHLLRDNICKDCQHKLKFEKQSMCACCSKAM